MELKLIFRSFPVTETKIRIDFGVQGVLGGWALQSLVILYLLCDGLTKLNHADFGIFGPLPPLFSHVFHVNIT